MEVFETQEFKLWLRGLRDTPGRRAIVKRLVRLQSTGSYGDAHTVGDGVSEMRFHIGPGYRVYYTKKDGTVILCGGDKGTQKRDIAKAKDLAKRYASLDGE